MGQSCDQYGAKCTDGRNSSLKPSRKAVQKARLAAAYRQHKKGRKYFRPLLITGSQVDFRYGGHVIQFIWESGRVLRVGADEYLYLQVEDYVLLHSEAEILMQAANNGYRHNQKKERLIESDNNKQWCFNF